RRPGRLGKRRAEGPRVRTRAGPGGRRPPRGARPPHRGGRARVDRGADGGGGSDDPAAGLLRGVAPSRRAAVRGDQRGGGGGEGALDGGLRSIRERDPGEGRARAEGKRRSGTK